MAQHCFGRKVLGEHLKPGARKSRRVVHLIGWPVMEHDSQPEAYCVHVWIRGIHPMLWRRFLVRSDSTLAASVSPGREVVDTAFGALHSCGRTEEVYPPYARTDGTCGRRRVRGESTTPPAAKPLTVTQPTPVMADILPNKNNLSKDVEIKGSVKFVNEFVFDGNLEGQISSVDGILAVGENADVRGEVKSKTVIVKGKVHGNI